MAKRRLVFRQISYRLLALAIVFVGIVAVRYYTSPREARFVFYLDIPPPPETEIGDRDISRYDYGGHVRDCFIFGEEDKEKREECFRSRDAARAFIEEHFRNHRRGYVIIDGVSADLPTPVYFFIEPDETDAWEIRVRYPIPGPYTRFHRNMITVYYSEAFRRRARQNPLLKSRHGVFIQDGANTLVLRSRGVYELVL